MKLQSKIALCTALVMATMPLTAAHLNENAPTDADLLDAVNTWVVSELLDSGVGGSNDDGCRYQDAATVNASGVAVTCVANDGPSGHYVNVATGMFAAAGAIPVEIELSSYLGITFFPAGFYFGAGGSFCDLEVLSDGATGSGFPPDPASIDNAIDEKNVDAGSGNGGIMPDATIDDGGDSAVCHVRTYQTPSFNSLGCDGIAYAEDLVSGPDVWTSTRCDWLTTTGGNDENDGLNCLINEIIQGKSVPVMQACVMEFILGTLTPTTSPTIDVCGGDGSSDDVNYGTGGSDEGLGETGVAYPALTNSCAQTDATAAAAVMPSVQRQTDHYSVEVLTTGCATVCPTNLGPAGANHLSLATAGWIDYASDGTSAVWSPSPGTHVQILDPVDDCEDLIDNDGDGNADAADSDCQAGGSGDEETAPGPSPTGDCANAFDDDQDGVSDFDDPDCHSDLDASNPGSYDPTAFE
jgi:hypothetical protein